MNMLEAGNNRPPAGARPPSFIECRFTVFDGSLRLAEEVVQDRAERAREELRQHDVPESDGSRLATSSSIRKFLPIFGTTATARLIFLVHG